MSRRIRNFCAVCHKQIYKNEPYELESDLRGVVSHIYHSRCVVTQRNGTDEVKE